MQSSIAAIIGGIYSSITAIRRRVTGSRPEIESRLRASRHQLVPTKIQRVHDTAGRHCGHELAARQVPHAYVPPAASRRQPMAPVVDIDGADPRLSPARHRPRQLLPVPLRLSNMLAGAELGLMQAITQSRTPRIPGRARPTPARCRPRTPSPRHRLPGNARSAGSCCARAACP